MKRLAYALVAMLIGFAAVPMIATVSNAEGLDGLVTAEAESYAMRVEYDIPLPAGAGDIPHTIGEIRRTSAGENAKGLAAAPTHMGAVVIGQYVNPNKQFDDPADYNMPPQAECFYPGDLVDVVFGFPTDTREQSENVPPISKARAQCGAGPITNLEGTVDNFEGPGITARGLSSTSLMQTAEGVDRSTTAAKASDIEIAGGAITIGGVAIAGESSVTGKKGGNATSTRLEVNDIKIAGLQFSIANDRLIVGDTNVPLVGNASQALVEQANALLLASGCRVDVISNPSKYPQGYLFARPEPKVGLSEDGTFAASMRAGMLIVCDLPKAATPTDLSPQRMQIVLGFAYTAASATADPGGFGLGNLGGSGDSNTTVGAIGSLSAPLAPNGELPAAPAVDAVDAPEPTERVGSARRLVPTSLAVTPLNGSTRLMLFVFFFTIWPFITYWGIERLRRTP